MPNYDPHKHHRRSIRLKGFDYAQVGAYFVTICTQRREAFFGEIVNGDMKVNDAGAMVERWWNELERKFPSYRPDAFVVMPNHLHAIVIITEPGATTLGCMMGWFKTMATNEYICCVKQSYWKPFHGRLFQRNYYEHIIRNEHEFVAIRAYIQNNRYRWTDDMDNPQGACLRAIGIA